MNCLICNKKKISFVDAADFSMACDEICQSKIASCTLASLWKAAKERFVDSTGHKKPSAGFFHSSKLEPATEALDKLLGAFDIKKAKSTYENFKKQSAQYIVVLEKEQKNTPRDSVALGDLILVLGALDKEFSSRKVAKVMEVRAGLLGKLAPARDEYAQAKANFLHQKVIFCRELRKLYLNRFKLRCYLKYSIKSDALHRQAIFLIREFLETYKTKPLSSRYLKLAEEKYKVWSDQTKKVDPLYFDKLVLDKLEQQALDDKEAESNRPISYKRLIAKQKEEAAFLNAERLGLESPESMVTLGNFYGREVDENEKNANSMSETLRNIHWAVDYELTKVIACRSADIREALTHDELDPTASAKLKDHLKLEVQSMEESLASMDNYFKELQEWVTLLMAAQKSFSTSDVFNKSYQDVCALESHKKAGVIAIRAAVAALKKDFGL